MKLVPIRAYPAPAQDEDAKVNRGTKAKKVTKQLADVEEMLPGVIERHETNEKSLRKLFDEAKDCIVQARTVVSSRADAPAAKGKTKGEAPA